LRDDVTPSEEEAENTPSASFLQPPNILFRQQAINHIMVSQYGTMIVAHPASHAILTCIFAVLISLLIAFFSISKPFERHQFKGC